MTTLRDYNKDIRRQQMERFADRERMVSEFTSCGACWMCGYNGSPGWLHDADTDERIEKCPVCNQKENDASL